MKKMTLFLALAIAPALLAQVQIPTPIPTAVIDGLVGPSPYNIIRGWQKPFAEPGFAFGGNSEIGRASCRERV